MARGHTPVEWTSNEGRNDWDDPMDVPDTMSVESLNVSLRRSNLGNKRPGSTTVPFTGDFFNSAAHLARFLPGGDLSLVELFIVDATGRILRVAGTGNVATALTLVDDYSFVGVDRFPHALATTTAQLNGKLYLAYKSAVNRLHVYDPATSTTVVRRVGLPLAVPPTVTNIGVGTYPATRRSYRIAWRVVDAGTTRIRRQSELSAAVSFTPSGTGLAAHVTKPTTPVASEGVTHWVVYGSPDDEIYYELAVIALPGTTYDDSELVALYNQHPAAPFDGSNFPFPSVRYLASDGVRLFGFGQWPADLGDVIPGDSVTVQPGTAYWTPPQGSSEIGNTVGVGDDERYQSTVFQDDRLPLSVIAGGVDRGISGPFYNSMYFFQDRGIYKLVPTDDATAPFRRVTVTRFHGSVSHWSQVMGEDELGNECLYFLDPKDGPRRIVVGDGIQWLGKDVNALWQTVNLSAMHVAHGVYDRATKQVIWWIAAGVDDFPGAGFNAVPPRAPLMIVYHVTLGRSVAHDESIRGGFVRWTGQFGAAYTSLLFPITITGPRPIKECAYTGGAAWVTPDLCIYRQDVLLTTDSGVPYQAYVTSKAWYWGLLVRRKRILEAFVTANAAAGGTTIQHSIVKDFGVETISQDVLIETPLDTHATFLRAPVQGCDIADGICDQVQLGDTRAVNNTWGINRWDALVEAGDAR